METTSIWVEKMGYQYGCHRLPSGQIRCGACGCGTVKNGRCSQCKATLCLTSGGKPLTAEESRDLDAA